jgi:hypothetical protein
MGVKRPGRKVRSDKSLRMGRSHDVDGLQPSPTGITEEIGPKWGCDGAARFMTRALAGIEADARRLIGSHHESA